MIEILREHIDEIRELRYGGMKMKDLAAKYNVTYSTLTHFLTTNRIVLNPKQIEPEVIEKIINDYNNGISYELIAQEVHMDKEAVRNILTTNSIDIRDKSHSHRLYSVNETYFDEIDEPNKAYILGLLYADGNVSDYKGHYSLRLKLQDRDMDILYKINDIIHNERPLMFINCCERENVRNQYLLQVDNRRMITSLMKYGVVPNKTDKVEFPTFLRDDLYRDFIRGCIDGDGTLSHDPKRHSIGLCGRDKLVLGVKNYLENKLNVHFTVSKGNEAMESFISISSAGYNQVKKICDYLYKDAELYLNRKYGYYLYMYTNESKSFVA